MKRLALIDMDGTLADYDKAMKWDLKMIAHPSEQAEIESLLMMGDRSKWPAYIKARERMIRSQPNWWFNLEPRVGAFEVATVLQDLGFDLHICTKVPSYPAATASEQKIRWCEHWLKTADLGNVPITVSGDKGIVFGDILYDDWPEYITPWLNRNPNGFVIMPAHPWNESFAHPNIYRIYDGYNRFDSNAIEILDKEIYKLKQELKKRFDLGENLHTRRDWIAP